MMPPTCQRSIHFSPGGSRDECACKQPFKYSAQTMRVIGRPSPHITANPTAQALRLAAVHQRSGAALASVCSTGIAKGVYRFASQEDADRQVQDALVRVVAANAARMRTSR